EVGLAPVVDVGSPGPPPEPPEPVLLEPSPHAVSAATSAREPKSGNELAWFIGAAPLSVGGPPCAFRAPGALAGIRRGSLARATEMGQPHAGAAPPRGQRARYSMQSARRAEVVALGDRIEYGRRHDHGSRSPSMKAQFP